MFRLREQCEFWLTLIELAWNQGHQRAIGLAPRAGLVIASSLDKFSPHSAARARRRSWPGWAWQIPLAWLLAIKLEMGRHGVYVAMTVAFSTLAVVSGIIFRRGWWKARTV